jgi:hypothetical protein
MSCHTIRWSENPLGVPTRRAAERNSPKRVRDLSGEEAWCLTGSFSTGLRIPMAPPVPTVEPLPREMRMPHGYMKRCHGTLPSSPLLSPHLLSPPLRSTRLPIHRHRHLLGPRATPLSSSALGEIAKGSMPAWIRTAALRSVSLALSRFLADRV